RGTPPAPAPLAPVRVADLAADAAALITHLGVGPCRVMGASLGAMVAQELAVRRPELVSGLALLATRCRTDQFRARLGRAQAARVRTGVSSDHDALAHLLWLFSPRTLLHEQRAADWFTLFRRFPVVGLGPAAQYEATLIADQTTELGKIDRPCLVMAFADDVLTPPELCQEVASAIPESRYVCFPDCGHFGFLEHPGLVNAALLEFFASVPRRELVDEVRGPGGGSQGGGGANPGVGLATTTTPRAAGWAPEFAAELPARDTSM
ncbi:MAG: alpha/beta fold hydrolase, partial [Micromonosporaceae bacterium]